MLELVIAALLFGDPVTVTLPACDTTADRLALLVAHANRLRTDSTWASRAAKDWGWRLTDSVEVVTSGPACNQALAALQSDGHDDIRQVALVRVGSGYLVQPGERWDYWIVLDKRFRVLVRIFAA